eukprot:TRINITY_DN18586_c0_g1_i1.p1 TRINITY_DN18586_c0_g1~~TRINITY_DN18586_c0_g1_i1.p1  ORF type:complete len:364 (+),score=31.01 TRINITY_DN18586_c0_g1_i1:214-1305(+)
MLVVRSASLSLVCVASFLLVLVFGKTVIASAVATGVVYGWTYCLAFVLALWHCMSHRHSERILKSVFGFVLCVPLFCVWISCAVRGHCLSSLFGETRSRSSADLDDSTLIGCLLLSFGAGYLVSFILVGVQTCCPQACSNSRKHPHLSISQAELSLDTGDIILTSDRQLPSKLIKMFTLSRSSHAILVIRGVPDDVRNMYGCHHPGPNGAYALEATPTGVRMEPLTEWLRDAEHSDFYDLVYVRRLYCSSNRDMLCKHDLFHLMRDACGKPFEQSPCRLLRSILNMNDHDTPDQYFCSELVATAYRALGVFSKDSIAANVTPDELLMADLDRDYLPWSDKQLFHLGPKMIVDIFHQHDQLHPS